MKPRILSKPLLITALILPLVLFQGIPEQIPDFVNAFYLGVPGTVWATSGWFVLMILLSWHFGKSNTDYLGEDQA